MAADPETGIITDEKLTQACGTENSDAAVAAEFVAAEAAAGTGGDDCDRDRAGGLLAWYGDSAYGTGDLRAAIAGAGHRAVIKPWPMLPAVEGGFTHDDFIVNPARRRTVTCPAGVTRHVTAKNAAIFGVACRDCPLRQRCTTAKDGRTLHLHQHDSLLRAARAASAAGPGLRQDYMAHRPHVSGSSPRSPPGADAASSSATAEQPGTTPGSNAAPPRSTCAPCSAAAWPATTAPGCWPPDQTAGPCATIQPRKQASARGPRPGSGVTCQGQGPKRARSEGYHALRTPARNGPIQQAPSAASTNVRPLQTHQPPTRRYGTTSPASRSNVWPNSWIAKVQRFPSRSLALYPRCRPSGVECSWSLT